MKLLPNLNQYLIKFNFIQTLKGRKTMLIGFPTLIIMGYLLISTENSINIPTYKVHEDKFTVSLTESGELKAKNSITITAPKVSGELKITYMISEGTYVKPGVVVCKFDSTDAYNKLKEAESRLEIAVYDKERVLANQEAERSSMESDLKNAELSYELSKLGLDQIKFEAEIKQRQAKLEHQKNELNYLKVKEGIKSKKIILKSELNKINLEIKQRKNDVEKARRELSSYTLVTPSEGLVVYAENWSNNGRKFTIGDKPWPGSVIMTLPDLSVMESITEVNEVDISLVNVGEKVNISLDAFQDSVFIGKIGKVSSLGKIKQNNSNIKTFEVIVEVNKKSQILKPGMTTINEIFINEVSNALFVPLEAIFHDDNELIVYVKNGYGFDKRIVKTGLRNADYVIIESGVKEGDEIALLDPNKKLDSFAKKELE